MSEGQHVLLFFTFMVSLVVMVWVGFLLFAGVRVFGCTYLVPVVHHRGVLTCSTNPRPIHVP